MTCWPLVPIPTISKDIVVGGVFYARLPRWEQIADAEVLAGTEPHEIERLFFGHCRMEPAWPSFDFAVDVTAVYERKVEALSAYASVFSDTPADLVDKYTAEDRYVVLRHLGPHGLGESGWLSFGPPVPGGCGTAHVGTPNRGSSQTCSPHQTASTPISVNALSM